MRVTIRWIPVIILLAAAESARADYELVVKKNCLACHQIEKRKYGPNFKEVAAKYADRKDAIILLANFLSIRGERRREAAARA